jgi:hypothetical protein
MTPASARRFAPNSPAGPISGRVGALVAGVLCFASGLIATASPAYDSGVLFSWWPLVLIVTIFWALVAAGFGAFAGRIAAGASSVGWAALVGGVLPVPTLIVLAILFVSPPAAQLRLVLFAGSIGMLAGGAAWRAVRFGQRSTRGLGPQVSLTEMFLILTAFAVHLGAYAL